jgi:hypothetical protein
MPSKPRHGRDYRMRTPQNSNLVQAPGAAQGFVNVLQVNLTSPTQLQIDFDSPVLAALAAGDFVVTQTNIVGDLINDPAGGTAVAASSVTIEQFNTQPSNGRIVANFAPSELNGNAIDPTVNFCAIKAQANSSLQFAGRLLYPGYLAQLIAIQTP